MEWERFNADLLEKETVLLMRNPDGGLVEGFSTAMTIDTFVDDVPIRAVFSGDTIINKEFWGEKTLGVLWLQHVFNIKKTSGDRRVFWFLVSMGYKTYRLMRLFFKNYWPRHSAITPEFETTLINHLGRLKFAANFNPLNGVISFDGSREKLRCGVADVDESRIADKDIAFFIKRNPGWNKGNELVCVAEICGENLRSRIAKTFSLDVVEPLNSLDVVEPSDSTDTSS
jgi:hypothetical protein